MKTKCKGFLSKKTTDQVGVYAMIAILVDINGVVMIVYILETEF